MAVSTNVGRNIHTSPSPCPQTAIRLDRFTEKACPATWQYLYAGACMCDPGYWCTCSSADLLECRPANDSLTWNGHYTNETGVYIAESHSIKCGSTLYCPGDTDPDACPNLCPAGHYCPTPAEVILCPKGCFCPRGSVSPHDCPILATCTEGSEFFKSLPLVLILVSVCIIIYLFNVWEQNAYLKRATNRKLAALFELEEECTDETSEELESHNSAPLGGPDVGLSQARLQWKSPTPKPSRSFSTFQLGFAQIPQKKIRIEFQGLRLTLRSGHTLLSGVNGSIPTGKITAVMGPSGAGKTTFLNVMAGKAQRTGGSVYVNGVVADLEEYKGIIGFVPQDDTMLHELTVEEVITHSAYMRLPVGLPSEEKDEIIKDVINSLGLTHVQNSVIGDELRHGVSGGERKRVSVGIEIVTKPSFLCLDEPTSGLDSVASLSLVKALKELATQGVTIVAVLHQPKYDIFALFDNVLLLGIGGRTVYLGPACMMKYYFEEIGFSFPPSSNPADYCMDIVGGLVEREGYPKFVKEDLFDLWIEYCSRTSHLDCKTPTSSISHKGIDHAVNGASEDGMSTYKEKSVRELWVEQIKHTTGWQLCVEIIDHILRNMRVRNKFRTCASFWAQFRLLFYRCLLQRLHRINVIPVLMALLGGSLIGIASADLKYNGIPEVLLESTFGLAYLLENTRIVNTIPGAWARTSLAIVLICIPGIEVFGLERANFFREASTGLHVTAYWLAKTVDTLMWIPLYSIIFTSLIYSLSPMYIEFYRFWLIIIMAYIGFYATGMIVSVLVNQANRGIVALIFGLVLTFLFSGVAIKYGDSHVQGLFWLFFPFWTAQAFVASEYAKLSPPYNTVLLNEPSNVVGYGYDLSSSFVRNIGYAALTAFAWYFIVLICLKFAGWRQQR